MRIIRSIQELSSLQGPIVLAVGTFDGLHLGHQALIRRAMEEADHLGGTAVVMTFDRHPASIVRPGHAPRLLTTNGTKISLLDRMRVPSLLLLDFTPALASIPAENFIASLVAASKPLSMICVGSQWSFGKGGEGNIPLLLKSGENFGFSVVRIDPVKVRDHAISSTRIRNAIGAGDFDQVSLCLGRPWLLSGCVVTGAGLGASIGFPTANLKICGMQLPPDGVYAVRVIEDDRVLTGVCNIGMRPTVDDSAVRTVEVHLFHVSENLVGKELSVEFVKHLRAEQKFSGLQELKEQIASDCVKAKIFLE